MKEIAENGNNRPLLDDLRVRRIGNGIFDSVRLPVRRDRPLTIRAAAYETRTEQNTEVLGHVMPPCQALIGTPSPSGDPGMFQSNPALLESGVIIPHAGIVGNAELNPGAHGWRNPVSQIVITRVR